ncbi:hypothetical protein Hanom_Chr01g00006351 [Helianthus anomalus]
MGVPCYLGLTPALLIIIYGIQVKGEYGRRRFVLDGRRCFIHYSTGVPLCGWRSGFLVSGRAKRLTAVE